MLNWTHESYKLYSISYSLIVFILLDIECSEIIPSKSYSILKTLQNMEQSAIVKAVTF
jgi:predicted acyltransferase